MPKPPIIPAELVVRLRAAKSIAVLTGAGISAESGVPTFRDSLTGHWARFRPEELATPEAFQRNPSLVWMVEINPHPTPPTPRVAFALAGPAGEWLPALVRATFD
jgi:NAD-dependent SIR2 family protein deacetylase